MADLTEERLRELSQGATIYGHERNAIAAELLAARAELREAMELLRAFSFTIAPGELDLLDRRTALLAKHKETNQ